MSSSKKNGAGDDRSGPGTEEGARDLARRFLDLWQEQASAMARDPEMLAMLRMMMGMAQPGHGQTGAPGPPGPYANQPPQAWQQPWQLWQQMVTGMMMGANAPQPWTGGGVYPGGVAPGGGGEAAGTTAASSGNARGGAAAAGAGGANGAAAPADAPDDGADAMEQLTRRLALLEERLAALEAEPAGRKRPGTGGGAGAGAKGRPAARGAAKDRS